MIKEQKSLLKKEMTNPKINLERINAKIQLTLILFIFASYS